MKSNYKRPVGIVGYYCGLNYGSHLTNYATYLFLKENGYSVLMIDITTTSKLNIKCPLFYHSPYGDDEIVPRKKSKVELKALNELCDIFVATSDQQLNSWVYNVTGKTSTLDWITKNKKIIAYAASWGNDFFTGSERERAVMSYFLKQIDFFSVREQSAVQLAENDFGIKSEFVLDPVFLCNSSVYENLANKARIKNKENRYAFCYILDNQEAYDSLLDLFHNKMGLQTIIQTDAAKTIAQKLKANQSIHDELHIEDWLYSINNCDFYITDSFHGSCLGIILKKQFVVILNKRGAARIYSIMQALGLESRIAQDVAHAKEIIEKGEIIDYVEVFNKLEHLKQKSTHWLLSALESESQKKSLSTYDICDARADSLAAEISLLRRDIVNLKKIIDSTNKTLNDISSNATALRREESDNKHIGLRRRLSKTIAYPVRDVFRKLRKTFFGK